MSSDAVPFSKIKGDLKEATKPEKSGVVIETPDYVFLLYQLAPDRWVKASWIFKEGNGYRSTVSTKRALLYLIDEVTESLNRYKKDEWAPLLSPREVESVIKRVEG